MVCSLQKRVVGAHWLSIASQAQTFGCTLSIKFPHQQVLGFHHTRFTCVGGSLKNRDVQRGEAPAIAAVNKRHLHTRLLIRGGHLRHRQLSALRGICAAAAAAALSHMRHGVVQGLLRCCQTEARQ
jgi:hypothetical protein